MNQNSRQDTATVLQAIKQAYANHVDAHMRGDAAGATALYAENIWIIWDGGHEVHSRLAQQEFYAQIHANAKFTDLVYTTEDLVVCGEVAYEVASYTLESEGELGSYHDKYLAVWRRQPDGSWKIHRMCGHSVKVQG